MRKKKGEGEHSRGEKRAMGVHDAQERPKAIWGV